VLLPWLGFFAFLITAKAVLEGAKTRKNGRFFAFLRAVFGRGFSLHFRPVVPQKHDACGRWNDCFWRPNPAGVFGECGPEKNTSRNTKNDRLDVSAFSQKLLDGVSKKIVVSFQNRPAKTLPCPPENTSANVRKNHWRQLVNFLTPPPHPVLAASFLEEWGI